MPTDYEQKREEYSKIKCGEMPAPVPPWLMWNPLLVQQYARESQGWAMCMREASEEYDKQHRLAQWADRGADIGEGLGGAALTTLMMSPWIIILVVVVFVIFIAWGVKGGVQKRVGGA